MNLLKLPSFILLLCLSGCAIQVHQYDGDPLPQTEISEIQLENISITKINGEYLKGANAIGGGVYKNEYHLLPGQQEITFVYRRHNVNSTNRMTISVNLEGGKKYKLVLG